MAHDFEKFIAHNAVIENPPMVVKPLNSPYVACGKDLKDAIQGAMPNFALYYVLRSGMFTEPPHYHSNDEYLMFLSSNSHDMKNLGAVVQIGFGEEWAKVEFSTSTIVLFPQSIQHCPIHVKTMERPFLFGHFWPMTVEQDFLPGR
jgi:hypothetical protein